MRKISAAFKPKQLTISLSFFIACGCFAQTPAPKVINAVRAAGPIKIDGNINDSAWKQAPVFSNLVEFRPDFGKPEPEASKTIGYLLYDDDGIYFGGYCYERTKDSISMELAGRDGFGANDYIGIIFDTYNDKLNGFEYFLTPLGEQWDAKTYPSDKDPEDFTWNAVWKSAAAIHNDGWSFEIFIPYSAIRFGKKDIQNWGVNITRRRRKTEQQYMWNPVNPNVNGFLTQEGIWLGLTHIKPPLRLQLSPYLSTYINHFPGHDKTQKDWTSSVNGGMDVKYGLNQAFTLDATLIPDFGQVQSDNRVLNLTPFEVKYNENRPFFTEGTELFNKGNLFYARRIGIDPVLQHSAYDSLGINERVAKDPVESKLINATKISGRSQQGLGVGLLNAVTKARYAAIEDTVTHQQRNVLVDPLSNYNIFVLDQTLKHNSSVTLVNTSVIRSGHDYDANVTAALFSFNDKKNMWNISGKFANSRLTGYLKDGKTQSGYTYNWSFGKTSGRFNFTLKQELADDKYNSNDFAYFTNNNYLDHSLWVGYRWTKPTSWYNNIFLNGNATHSRRLTDFASFQGANYNVGVNSQLKNLCYIGLLAGYEPSGNNFYEPRVAGRYFRGWSNYFFDAWFQSNNAWRYGFYYELLYVKRDLFNSERYMISIKNGYRFNNRFSMEYQLNLAPQNNNVGYAAVKGNDVIFGKRDIKSVEDILLAKYAFSPLMSINARARHYWTEVRYDKFFTLRQDGGLDENHDFSDNVNQNYNLFNVDLVYTWQFAPGSFLNVVWKNSISKNGQDTGLMYFKNLDNTLAYDQNNNFSIKVIYFLDYLQVRKKFQKKS